MYTKSTYTHAPISPPKHLRSTWNSVRLPRIRLHANPPRALNTQQIIHDLKPLIPLRKVDSRDVHDALELALRVVAQEGEDLNDARRRGVQHELVLQNGELLDVLREALEEVCAVRVQRLGRRGVLRQRGVGRRGLGERRGGGCSLKRFSAMLIIYITLHGVGAGVARTLRRDARGVELAGGVGSADGERACGCVPDEPPSTEGEAEGHGCWSQWAVQFAGVDSG